MKSDDLRKLVLSKLEKGKMPTDVFCEMEGAVSLRTIERWKRMHGQGEDVIGRRYEQPQTRLDSRMGRKWSRRSAKKCRLGNRKKDAHFGPHRPKNTSLPLQSEGIQTAIATQAEA